MDDYNTIKSMLNDILKDISFPHLLFILADICDEKAANDIPSAMEWLGIAKILRELANGYW